MYILTGYVVLYMLCKSFCYKCSTKKHQLQGASPTDPHQETPCLDPEFTLPSQQFTLALHLNERATVARPEKLVGRVLDSESFEFHC